MPVRLRTTAVWAVALAVPLAVANFGTARGDDEPVRDGATSAPARAPEPPEVVAKTMDIYIRAAWKEQGLTAHARCTDAEFARRVFLDIVGTVPTAEQVQAFLADKGVDKRPRLVESLLATPGYARRAADLWGQTLVGQGTNDNNRGYNASLFRNWLEESLAANRPYDALVTDMLTGTGTVFENAALNFSGRRDHKPTDLAGAVSKSFLGVQIQCAQCHDHPYEQITQADFQGFAAFWARTTQRRADIPYDKIAPAQAKRYAKQVEDDTQKFMKERGLTEPQARALAERRVPKTVDIEDVPGGSRFPERLKQRKQAEIGEIAAVPPKFLLGDVYEDTRGETRRQALAKWIVDPANPYTSRALANRYWGWYLGRGFVQPVDDFSSVNIPSVPEALAVLSEDTAAHGFDLKRLVRVITATEAYQLSTVGDDRTPLSEEFFATGPLKPLSPQQTFDALQVALGVVDDGAAMSGLGKAMSALEMEKGAGMMVMDGGDRDRTQARLRLAARSFFQTFEDDEGEDAGSFDGTIPQGLFLMNSQVVNGILTDPKTSIVPKVYASFSDEGSRVSQLFLRTLSREPTRDELSDFVKLVKSSPKHIETEPADRGAAGDNTRAGRKPKKGRLNRRFVPKEDRAVAAYADVLWVLISTSEFNTNH